MYATFPEGLEMLFLMAFSIGHHSAATLIEFAFLFVLPCLMFCYSRRFGFQNAGLAAAIWVFVSPVFAVAGTSAYNDVAGACAVFSVFYLLRVWEDERQPNLLWLIGMLAGFCFSIKYTLATAVPFAAAYILLHSWRTPRRAARDVAIVLGSAAPMVLPWMIKNWIVIGNPLAPFMNGIFPNPYFTVHAERGYLAALAHAPVVSGWGRVWDHLIIGTYTQGLLGPIFILFPLAIIAVFWRDGRRLVAAAVLFALPAFGNSGTRFLMTAVPFVALALSLVLRRVKWLIPFTVGASLCLCWPPIENLYCKSAAWRLTDWRLEEALRMKPEGQILNRRLDGGYDLAQLIERSVPPNGQIYTFGSPPESYINRRVVVSYESAYGLRIRDFLLNPLVPDWEATGRIRFSFARHLVRKLRVIQTASAREQWSISEFRILNGKDELPRAAEWRIQAKPNPWDVALAFDGSPATRWLSGEDAAPGMRVTVAFEKPRLVDAVVLECSHDQWHIKLALEEEIAPGHWLMLNDRPAMSNEPMQWDLRVAATQAASREGITHILVPGGEFGSKDFASRPLRWNLSYVGEAGGFRLYAIL